MFQENNIAETFKIKKSQRNKKVMNDNSVNFIKPEKPLIIVKQLTQQVIEEAINEYALKLMVIG